MKSITKIDLLFFCLTLLDENDCNAQLDSFNAYVNPDIGTTHSRWFFHTPAANPFGMAKPAASTDGHYGNPQDGKLRGSIRVMNRSKVL